MIWKNFVAKTCLLLTLAVCAVFAFLFLAGCSSPLTSGGFDRHMAHNLGPTYGYLEAQHRMAEELQGEVAKLWASLGEVAKGQQTIAEWAATTTDRLVQLERAGKITQRDLGLARSAIDHLKKQMADARVASSNEHKDLGMNVVQEGVDTRSLIANEAFDTRDLVADVGRKVDERAGEVLDGISTVEKQVGVLFTTEQDHFNALNREVQRVGSGVEFGHEELNAAAKVWGDTKVEVGKARKELSDHDVEVQKALDAVKKHFGIP